MWPARSLRRSVVASITAFSLIMAPAAPIVSWLSAQTTQDARAADTAADVDLGWPRAYQTASGGAITVYQPQVSRWEDQARMTALAAVSYLPSGVSDPALGVITLEADTRVSLDERLVDFSNLAITAVNFSTLSREQAREVVAELVAAVPTEERIIALDRVLEGIDASQILVGEAPGVKADPPRIFWSTDDAILVALDGDPIWAPVQGLDLEFAVNTNWDLFTPARDTSVYLRHDESWLMAPSLAGPWAPAGQLPESFARLPDDENWADVRTNVPGRPLPASEMPRVFVSTEPAELIAIDGAVQYQVVDGTNLLWIGNTEADLFRLGSAGEFYYLVAGRWFSAPSLDGPWTFASTRLPDDFLEIPIEHERSRVLASVPGSAQANEAVLLAQVPRTARVNRRDVTAPEVVYQGEPRFEPIESTSLERAVNTDKDIVRAGERYYLCFQGVWFVSPSASGPWEVASTIPADVYEIPASSPVHHVTYVTVEEADDNDEWVTFAYMAGYTGMMIAWGTVVWGSGWHYPPYVWYGPAYPIYYPYPRTYGMAAWYNPWTGAYGRGGRVYGPYGGAGWGAAYNPRTGTYTRGAAAYGPYNARGAAQAWNPRTGTYAQTRQGANIYGSWGSTAVQRGDDWVSTRRISSNRTGATTRVTRTDDGAAISRVGPGGGVVAVGEGGNVYAGSDGSVYRREGGTWQKHENGEWTGVDTADAQARVQSGRAGTAAPAVDASTIGQLERDSTARATGRARTQDYATYLRSGGQRSAAGSYRSGGVTARGGRRR